MMGGRSVLEVVMAVLSLSPENQFVEGECRAWARSAVPDGTGGRKFAILHILLFLFIFLGLI
jgi:hypothetical protein